MTIKTLAIAAVCIGAAMGTAEPARAVTISKSMFIDPSAACQLSVPTIDTAVRPKATGFRNEGIASAFTICGTSMFSIGGVLPTTMNIQLSVFDGASHSVSCTAVSRDSTGSGPVYSTKSAISSSTISLSWTGADFGAGFAGFANSVTCTLPGGVAITGVRITFPDEIGT